MLLSLVVNFGTVSLVFDVNKIWLIQFRHLVNEVLDLINRYIRLGVATY